MARTRYKIKQNHIPYFQTGTIVGWLPIFTRVETVQILLDSFQWLRENKQFELYGYVILENHLHFVSSSPEHSKAIQMFKSYTARQIIDYLIEKNVHKILQQLSYYKLKHKVQSRYQLWQEGSHPEEIINADMMRQKLDYIHNNPVKRGYVNKPEHWRYSSASNYAGQAGLIDVSILDLT
ncbi:hypothetical protein [Candidatus Parabeggiatoa sp. HSG14]|uniref:REP-associated tyrosine transposase n=1 Tax=Candidatus Parabeggiatoa sp. HSG14 TaxID=3055593 RepID=UPI0025A6B9F4|nr:hypothetical protein [Thiotrichales bacterium HSG14]